MADKFLAVVHQGCKSPIADRVRAAFPSLTGAMQRSVLSAFQRWLKEETKKDLATGCTTDIVEKRYNISSRTLLKILRRR